VDDYLFTDFPGRSLYHGFALRLFDPTEKVWRIWWAAHPGGGILEPPVTGASRPGLAFSRERTAMQGVRSGSVSNGQTSPPRPRGGSKPSPSRVLISS
jgi:hypothetical protein